METRLKRRKETENKFSKMSINISKEDREMIGQIREMVIIRTFRANVYKRSSFYVLPIINHALKEIDLPFDLFLHLSLLELVNYTPEMKEIAKERKKDNICIGDTCWSGKEAEDLVKKFPELNRPLKVKEIKGKTAYPGKKIGKVKILKGSGDISKVKRGDVIVAVMTTPDFVSAMEKAIAFVTDEGGILCHAAIISREMRKPCIIGTREATRLLKDNDLVEVDADKGIVKKLINF